MIEPTTGADPLARLDTATRLLAQARTIDDVKLIRDQAEMMRMYARERDMGIEAQNHAAEIKVRAERRIGELLTEMPKQHGARPADTESHAGTPLPPDLKTLGLTKNDSSRFQQIAELPEPVFEQHVAEVKAGERVLTTAGVLRVAQEHQAEQDAATADRIVAAGMAADPSAEVRYQEARLRRSFARAVSKADDLLTLRPGAVVPVLDARDREVGYRVIRRFAAWANEFEAAAGSSLHVVGDP